MVLLSAQGMPVPNVAEVLSAGNARVRDVVHDFDVGDGVVDDISHEGLPGPLREEGVSVQRLKTWKTSRDPDTRPGQAPRRAPSRDRRR